MQESQNGITHFSEYVEIILCFILDLNAQNDWVKTTSIIPTDSTSYLNYTELIARKPMSNNWQMKFWFTNAIIITNNR